MKVLCLKLLIFQLVVIVLVLCWQAPRGEAQGDAPMIVGTWKLNLAKSKISVPLAEVPTGFITWQWDRETLKHIVHQSLDASGEPRGVRVRFSAKFDGQDYPVFESGDDFKAPVRHIRMKWIDAYRFEVTNPKSMRTFSHVISKDGKTDTITYTQKDATDIRVYERQ